jgi:hypothetical protein
MKDLQRSLDLKTAAEEAEAEALRQAEAAEYARKQQSYRNTL